MSQIRREPIIKCLLVDQSHAYKKLQKTKIFYIKFKKQEIKKFVNVQKNS